MSVRALQAAAHAVVENASEDNVWALEEALAGSHSKTLRETLRKVIEERWLARAEAQSLGKRTSMKYRKAEAEYFAGAMAALNAVFPNVEDPTLISSMVPQQWVFDLMIGQNIAKVGDGS